MEKRDVNRELVLIETLRYYNSTTPFFRIRYHDPVGHALKLKSSDVSWQNKI